MSYDGGLGSNVGGFSIEKADVKVFDLTVPLASTTQIVTNTAGDPLRFDTPGSVILFDPNGSNTPIALEINLDNQNPARWIPIQAGKVFSVWPFQFQTFAVRVTQLISATTGNTYVGRLVVARTLDLSLIGSGPETPTFTREAPCYATMGTALVNIPGTTGINSFVTSIIAAGAGIWASDFTLENIGPSTVFVSTTVGPVQALATSYQLLSNHKVKFRAGILPSNVVNPTRASSNTNTVWLSCETNDGVIAYVRTARY